MASASSTPKLASLIEWVEIPAGESVIGLPQSQINKLRRGIWKEYPGFGAAIRMRLALKRLIRKSSRSPQDQGLGRRSLTSLDRQLTPDFNDPRRWYFEAEAELEHIPQAQTIHLPTYYIAKYPITHEQADEFFSSSSGKYLIDQRVGAWDAEPKAPEEFSWKVAEAMASWLGGRLPTVEEWEKAARGVDGRLYPWGNEWDISRANFKGPRPTPVDKYPQGVSPYGVWDMAGNLSEWTKTRKFRSMNSRTDGPWAKGRGFRELPSPTWFWSITALDHIGGRNVGCRPILTERPEHY
jgi:hypothetical protein